MKNHIGGAEMPRGMMARRRTRRTRMRVRRMTVRRMRRRRRRRRRRRIILMGGMIALGTAAVYKMSKKDVQRVEEHTGKTAEELSDEELQAAIDDLQIQVDELSDAEYDEVEKADAEEEAEDSYLDELERLSDLRDKGIITDEEFEAKKKQLLGL